MRMMKVGVTIGWELGRWLGALVCLVIALGILVLLPLWFLDLLTLGSMRPPVVVWLRDVLTLQYSIAQVWTALPQHWPALWDQVVFGWRALGMLAIAGVGLGLLLLPFVWLFSQKTKQK